MPPNNPKDSMARRRGNDRKPLRERARRVPPSAWNKCVERTTSPLERVAKVNRRNTVRNTKNVSETDNTAAASSAITAITLTNVKSRDVLAVRILTEPRKKIRCTAEGRKPYEI